MNHTSDKPLLVVNASAGSGKTFNLVRNYLKLLLCEDDNRSEMGQIIAMTFTNKASIEMKTRIVNDLNKLANGGVEHSIFRNELATFIGLSPERTQANAKNALKKMLHNYEDFHVQTIDKFNLKLIRSFSRDLNLPEQFDISLDEEAVLEKAVDELLNTIDQNEKNKLYDLTVNYAKSNLDEENRWDIKQALLSSSQLLKNERYFDVIKKLTQKDLDKANFELWKSELNQIKVQFNELQTEFKQAFEVGQLIQSDLAGKSTTFNRLVKALNFDFKDFDLYEFTDSFQKNIEKTIEKVGNNKVFDSLLRLIRFCKVELSTIIELDLKINQFYLLSVLRELALSMDQIREKDAVIRISEFNKLVSDLVKDEEAPFIYERLGNRFSHYFLDEFQDTSRLQWRNLIPLMHESLSRGKFNFIVGDPKQSIYRFKNGVAEQFVALPKIYNPEQEVKIKEKSDYFEAMGSRLGLEENWRSAKEIVEFNNTLFEAIFKHLPETGKDHYNQIRQIPKGADGGLITLHLLNDKPKNPLLELEMLNKWVNECISDGYKASDICVLGRTKNECNRYANHLKSMGFSVVSSDSLLVNSDEAVRLTLSFLKWRYKPNDIQAGMLFAEAIIFFNDKENPYQKYRNCFQEIHSDDKLKRQFSADIFASTCNFDIELLHCAYQNLYGLIQQFLRSIRISPLQNAYIHQLLDIAFSYDQNNGPDLGGFIQHYETKAAKNNVQLPENESAIQIMTTHKSKGLEFPVVILPSLSYKSKSSGRNPEKFLIELNDTIVETKHSNVEAKIEAIGIEKEFEESAKIMDAFNLLYVAVTRPKDRLYVYSQPKHSDNFSKQIRDSIKQIWPEFTTKDGFNHVFGSKPKISQENKSLKKEFRAAELSDFLWFPEISLQSNEEKENNSLNKQKRLGTFFHKVMESCSTITDALNAIENMFLSGKIITELKEELILLAEEAFNNKELVELLNEGPHLDERTIAIDERTFIRPDKVIVSHTRTIIIDFKTGDAKPKDLVQINTYCNAFKDLNYKNVTGFLYYAGGTGLKKIESGLF